MALGKNFFRILQYIGLFESLRERTGMTDLTWDH